MSILCSRNKDQVKHKRYIIHVLIKLPRDYYNIWYFELTTLHNQTIQLLGNIQFHILVINSQKIAIVLI